MVGVLKPFILALTGSSLTTGRLSAPPQGFRAKLLHDLPDQPEAKGPIRIYDLGHGGWTSLDLLNNAPVLSGLKPTHILAEGGAINDCFDTGGGPTISRAQHIVNNIAMINEWKTNTPNSLITIQTMSSVDAVVGTARTALATYYADEIATATAQSVPWLDNFAAWPNPLDSMLTNGAIARQFALPAGFAEWTKPIAVDPATKNVNISLSSENQIATSGSVHCPARCTVGRNAGKFGFEVRPVPLIANGTGIGFMTAAGSLASASYVGSDAFGYGYFCGGNVVNNGGVLAVYATYGAGDVIDAMLDATAGKIWFAKNGVWQGGGDPALGTGGIAVTAGTYFPAFSMSSGDSLTLIPLGGDGLHPLWTGAFDTYSYPAILAWARAQMAAFWP